MSIKPGALRFNTDSMKLEIFRGSPNYEGSASMTGIGTLAAGQWEEIQATSPEAQTGGTRGIWNGTQPGTPDDTIQYVTISTTGNALDFGNSTVSNSYGKGGTASRTRGVWGGGFQPGGTGIDTIEYVTISSTGGATDFGNLTQLRKDAGGCGSSTRGLFTAGLYLTPAATYTNIIDYVTIASTGHAVDFGDTTEKQEQGTALSSPTRGIIAGGEQPGGRLDVINFVTISTLGNAADFGNLTQTRRLLTGAGNATRGIFGGGRDSPSDFNIIDYITISTLGNAIDFGDFSSTRRNMGAVSSPTRVLFAGGSVPGFSNEILYVTIASTGDAIDFGDLFSSAAEINNGGCSNGHGGL